jgi:endosialidase-like protein
VLFRSARRDGVCLDNPAEFIGTVRAIGRKSEQKRPFSPGELQAIDIGNVGVAGDSNTIRIGTTQTATSIAGIAGGTPAFSGAIVVIDSNGRLAMSISTVSSSQRFKDEIKPMDSASEAILALRPVTFLYKHERRSKSRKRSSLR